MNAQAAMQPPAAGGTVEPAEPVVQPIEETSRPIVSVNDGPKRKFPWTFYLFLALVFIVLVVAIAAGVSKMRPKDALRPASSTQPTGTPIDQRGSFVNKPLVSESPPVVAAPTPTINVSGTNDPCPNKPVIVAGQPLIGSNGLPLMQTCDGKPIPNAAVPTGSNPTVSIAGQQAPGTGQGPAAAPTIPADRYSGGVIIEPPPAQARPGEVPAPPQEALDILRRAEEAARANPPRPAGSSQTGGFFGNANDPQPSQVSSAGVTVGGAAAGGRGAQEPTRTQRHVARTLEARRFTTVRGTQVECSLTLAYVSDIAGDASCVVARDVFGHDGTTVLVDRGSIANGTFQAVTSLGARRAHVIWDRIVTPAGVVVTFSSKGTDTLGSAGMPAAVDNRWLDRLGVAVAISAVKDLTTAVVARHAASAAGGAVSSSAQNFADQVLQQTIAIRPTLYVRQGDTASIVLQSDLDFSRVYALRR